MDREDVVCRFWRRLYREIIEDHAFQRLADISFLGAIDYVVPVNRKLKRIANSRYQHTLGVAKLALHFAKRAKLSEREEKLIVTAALLHDVGHAPLSHSLEGVFQSHFCLAHHDAGAQVIRGESPLGKGILRTLQSNGIDADEVIWLIHGKYQNDLAHLFGSPMNIDTFEGILRCRIYMRNPIALTPDALVDGFLSFDRTAQARFDTFWTAKHYAYQFLINGRTGVLADALARKYMLEHIDDFSRDDYFTCERALLKRHRPLAKVLRNAKALLRSTAREQIVYRKRDFEINHERSLNSLTDLYARYNQRKSAATMNVPYELADISRSEQRCLFQATCEQ